MKFICGFKHHKYDCACDMSNQEYGCEECFYCEGVEEDEQEEGEE